MLVEREVREALEGLFNDAASIHPADEAGHRKLVERHGNIRRLAQQAGVVVSDRQVAQRAYQVGAFYLAREALEEAIQEGEIALSDRGVLRLYADTLRNVGFWWTTEGFTETTRYQGLRFLATCRSIGERFNLDVGRCQGDLHAFAGLDPVLWPPAAPSPFLVR